MRPTETGFEDIAEKGRHLQSYSSADDEGKVKRTDATTSHHEGLHLLACIVAAYASRGEGSAGDDKRHPLQMPHQQRFS